MITRIIDFSVRLRGVILALACLVFGYGIYALSQSRLDVFPEFTPPLVTIQTEAPGLSADQVEQLVTQRIENVLGGAIGLESMRSQSIAGVSVITLIFNDATDIHRARQTVAEQLTTVAGTLPAGVAAPAMTPLSSSSNLVLGIGLTSKKLSLMELRSVADWTIRPRLLSSQGVSDVGIYGGEIKQYQVRVQPDKLVKYGLSLQDVVKAAQRATGIRGAGVLDTANQRLVVNTIGQSTSAQQLGQVALLHKNGATVRLADIGEVVVGQEVPVSGANIQGGRGVVLMISNQYGSDIVSVTKNVEAALAELRPALEARGIELHADLFRPANFIVASIDHLRIALLVGGALVVIVLFLFLFNVRTAFISLTAIPLSLLSAVIVLHHFGVPLNTMTLGGLAIALGEVVDDAIIDVENIYRRLRENRQLPQPRPAIEVVIGASTEVRGAVIYATFIVALIFLPVLNLSGVAGKLFAPLGIAYILAIMASLVVALTVTPALCYAMLAGHEEDKEEPRVNRWLKERYTGMLRQVERHWGLALVAFLGFLLPALIALPFFGRVYLPELNEGHFIVHMQAAPGTSIQESMRVGARVSKALLEIPSVRSVAQRVGRTARGVDVFGPQYSEFEVDLKPGLGAEEQELAMADIRGKLANFPGLLFSAETFLTERVEETISGYTAPVIVNVFGPDLDVLDRLGRSVAKALNGVPGAAAVTVQAPPALPELSIRLRQDQLTRWGLAPLDVMDAIQAAYGGAEIAQVFEENAVYGVAVMLADEARRSPSQVGNLPLRTADGAMIPLGRLADIRQTDGRYLILHSGGQRLQTVTSQVHGRTVSEFVTEARKRIAADIKLPAGYDVAFSGEAQAQAAAQRELIINFAVVAVIICVLVFLALRSTRALLLVLANLPFALVGGALTVFATGAVLSIGSMVGFVTLFGITLRNSIMLISHYQHLVQVEGHPWNAETATLGASERLAPILITALVTGLGLLPLAVTTGEPGNEIEGPMAVVILGGLVTSTLLNLLVMPALALRFGRFERRTGQA
ncbi:efflux RND transporter permease subunit [Massilia horti]|uniref:Efflux RND transporter permease subunit n=1 Tax=Massilia horti TaxID=2562153 RepID=A0A4Y9SWS6_9BURK|nr:efflux RND transporter permease subunit [Massilia horti]TFW29103.1 efflux RND transporter permease subunit [Massilia horti]